MSPKWIIFWGIIIFKAINWRVQNRSIKKAKIPSNFERFFFFILSRANSDLRQKFCQEFQSLILTFAEVLGSLTRDFQEGKCSFSKLYRNLCFLLASNSDKAHEVYCMFYVSLRKGKEVIFLQHKQNPCRNLE